MKVMFTVSIAGEDFSYRPKQVTNLDEGLALAWIGSGICTAVIEPVADEPPADRPQQRKNKKVS